MFRLFASRRPPCPISQSTRRWMENAFLWLLQEYGEQHLLGKKQLIPDRTDFPVKYDGSRASLEQTAEIVARQMDIAPDSYQLEVYKDDIQRLRGGMGQDIFTAVDRTGKRGTSAGLYFGKNKAGLFDVFIEEKHLLDPEGMVAVLAHEFAHIKILGEERLDENDEWLTDLTTVAFGLGIFNANNCFRFFNGFDSWGYRSSGYLRQQDWGYALALYAYLREEVNPGWVKRLGKNIQGDFKKSRRFIEANPDKIFQEMPDNGPIMRSKQ